MLDMKQHVSSTESVHESLVQSHWINVDPTTPRGEVVGFRTMTDSHNTHTYNTHVPDTADTVTHGWVQTVCLMQGSVGDHSYATRWLPWVSDSDGDNPNRISIRVINSITTVIRVVNPSRVVIRVIRGSFLHKLTKVNRAAQPMITMNTIGDDFGRERGSKNDIFSNIILTSDDIHICDICIDSPYKHHIWPMIA